MTTSTIPSTAWRKSTYSNADGNCVEVAILPSAVAVSDSKDRAGPVLTFAAAEWRDLIGRAQRRFTSTWAEPQPRPPGRLFCQGWSLTVTPFENAESCSCAVTAASPLGRSK